MVKKKCATKLLFFLAAVLLFTYLLFIDNFYVLRLLQNGDNPDGNSSSSKWITNNFNDGNNSVNSDNTRGDRNNIYHDYLSVAEFTYIDAYNECCSSKTTTTSSSATAGGGLNCTE